MVESYWHRRALADPDANREGKATSRPWRDWPAYLADVRSEGLGKTL
jgi:hypothetical protein